MSVVAGFTSLIYAKSTSGSVSSSDLVDGLKDCSLSLPADMLETTNFKGSGGYKTRTLGLQDSSADLSGDFVAGDTVQTLIRAAKSSGATIYFTFLADPSASSGSQGYKIPMLVSEFTVKSTPAGLAEWTAKLTGNGAIVPV